MMPALDDGSDLRPWWRWPWQQKETKVRTVPGCFCSDVGLWSVGSRTSGLRVRVLGFRAWFEAYILPEPQTLTVCLIWE